MCYGKTEKKVMHKKQWPSQRPLSMPGCAGVRCSIIYSNFSCYGSKTGLKFQFLNTQVGYLSSRGLVGLYLDEHLPSPQTLLVHMLGYALVDEVLFYLAHRAAHHSSVYKLVLRSRIVQDWRKNKIYCSLAREMACHSIVLWWM